MEVKCNITTLEAFDNAVNVVTEKVVREFSEKNGMGGFIVGATNLIFATKLRRELFGGSEVEDD